MSSKKTKKATTKPSSRAAAAASTERARKAAIAEIGERLKGKPAKSALTNRPKGSTAKKTGGLTAAYQVLRGAKEPMRCGDIVAESIKRGLWSSNGKTPSATIHAAIIREIAARGKDARFRKVGRGLFAATKEE